jgi:predicted  nucleic acid-binding Zn-ribbon protein
MKHDLDSLNLSARTSNRLKSFGIDSVASLLDLYYSDSNFIKHIRQLGAKGYEEITSAITKLQQNSFNTNDISGLEQQKQILENKSKNIDAEIRALEDAIKKLNTEKSKCETQIKSTTAILKAIQNESKTK